MMKTITSALCRLRRPDRQQIIFPRPRFDGRNQVSQGRSPAHDGFTLIELLIVIAIIGLLAAIAIPQFVIYRTRSVDAQMKSDLRNASVAVESYFVTNHVYPTSVSVIPTLGFQGTQGVALSLSNVTANSYRLTAAKPGGTQPSYTFDSATGSIQ
jgi:type IV pilus assembly protein PilA